jgi:hypothetical protein
MADLFEIDASIRKFRIASRELFNGYFRIDNPYDNDGWDGRDQFSRLESILFDALVGQPHGLTPGAYGAANGEVLVKLRDLDAAPAQLNRLVDSGYWDHPITQIDSGAVMCFIRFFDWDQLDYRDNRFVRACVQEWPSQANAVGKHVLLEAQHVRFALRASPV